MKWIIKSIIVAFAEPIVDAILHVLEDLASKTGTNIDDVFVIRLRELRDVIISFIVSNAGDIAKAKKKRM